MPLAGPRPRGCLREEIYFESLFEYSVVSLQPAKNPKLVNKIAGEGSDPHGRHKNPPRETRAKEHFQGIFYLKGTQVVEKVFNQTWVGALRLQFYLARRSNSTQLNWPAWKGSMQ